jgi:hypothetical protein
LEERFEAIMLQMYKDKDREGTFEERILLMSSGWYYKVC